MDSQKKDKTTQSDKFIEAAKKLECDEDEIKFNEKLKKLSEKGTNKKPNGACQPS